LDAKFYVYADGPDSNSHVKLHIFHCWTGYPVANLTIKVPLEDGTPVDEVTRIIATTFESSQERWNYEALGLENLDSAKGLLTRSAVDQS
jgi:hypothetical protein